MAFMENIGGITGKFKHEPSEIERVQNNILQVENEMQQRLAQIGQMYYRDNLTNENIEKSYREVIDMITKLDENRKGFYAHKLRLEGNMACANCGQIIPYGSVFCSNCGKRADEKEEGSPAVSVQESKKRGKVCPNCSAIYQDEQTKFCATCGTQLD